MANMTYAQAIDIAIAALGEGEASARLEALKAQLAKRGSSKSPTKTQKENVAVMESIVNALAAHEEPVTITELMRDHEELGGYTNQKLSALLRQLKDAGKVEKVKEGRYTKFSLV